MAKAFSKRVLFLLAVLFIFAIICPLVVSADTDTHSHHQDGWACRQILTCAGLDEEDTHEHVEGCYDTSEPICGIAQHSHEQGDCDYSVLVCHLPEVAAEDAHSHDASCYGSSAEASCGYDYDHQHDGISCSCELTAHMHDLVCSLADEPEHICPAEDCNWVCADAFCPDYEHEHSEQCCTLHVHDESCYQQQLLCGKAESTEHTHSIDQGCYGCSLTEHSHSWQAGCYEIDAESCPAANLHTQHDSSCSEWVCLKLSSADSDNPDLQIGDLVAVSAELELPEGMDAELSWYLNGALLPDTGDSISGLPLDYLGINTVTCALTFDGDSEPFVTQSLSFEAAAAVEGDEPQPFFSALDTSNITVRLFNYGQNINGGTSGAHADSYGLGFFGEPNYDDSYENHSNSGSGKSGQVITRNLGGNGYPVSQNNGLEFAYLFSPAGNAGLSVDAYALDSQQSGLFQQDSNGYYYYRSAENGAYYDAASQRFWLYDATHYPHSVAAGKGLHEYHNFLPFNNFAGSSRQELIPSNTGGESIVSYQLPGIEHENGVDLWFGMSVDFQFLQPKGGMVSENNPMVFKFEGDDDVWVFIDGMRVIDLSGTHAAETATIDFSTGKVTHKFVGQSQPQVTDLKEHFIAAWIEAGESPAEADALAAANFTAVERGGETCYILRDYSEHLLNFFYMERGGYISYCSLEFNIITVPKNTLAVTKEVELPDVEAGEEVIVNADFPFQLLMGLDADGLAPAANYPYNVYLVADPNNPINTEPLYTDEQGRFSLKHNQTARFAEIAENYFYQVIEEISRFQYDKIIINDTTVELDEGGEIHSIATDVLSAAQNRSALFTNYCTQTNLLPLYLSKTGDNVGEESFEFAITFDNQPKWMTVTIFDSEDGEASGITASYNGSFALKAGQSAKIHNIVGDSSYRIEEIGAEGYATSYSINGADALSGKAAEGSVIFDHQNQPTNEVVFNNEATAVLIVSKQVNQTEGIIGNNLPASFVFKVTVGSGGDVQIFTFALADGESWRSPAFPAHIPYWVEEISMPLGYSYAGAVADEQENLSPSYGYLAADQPTEVVMQNNIVLADLIVKKNVTNAGDLLDAQQEFSFQVIFNGDTADLAYRLNGSDDLLTAADGVFTLRHDDYAKFSGIQAGCSYSVQELTAELPAGIVYAGGSQSGLLAAQQLVMIDNTVLKSGLNITKLVEGQISNGFEGSFSFRLSLNGAPAANQPYHIIGSDSGDKNTDSNGVFHLAAGETANFAEISVGSSYSVEEIDIPAGFVLAGSNPQSGIISSDSDIAQLIFVNQVQTADLRISKRVVNTANVNADMDGEGTFIFMLTIEGQPYSGLIAVGDDIRTADAAGRFFIHAGETAIVSGLQVGSSYSVSEDIDNLPLRYTLASTSNTNSQIAPAGSAALIINHYTPPSVPPRPIPPIIIIPDPEVPGGNIEIPSNPPPGGNIEIPSTPPPGGLITIDDPQVPLAGSPKTGDQRLPGLLLAFAAIALGSVWGMRKIIKSR
jgi:fibro-slime domain-containing protein